jgi:hypothetical protein
VFGREEVNREEKEEPSRTVFVRSATTSNCTDRDQRGFGAIRLFPVWPQWNLTSGSTGTICTQRRWVGVGCDDPTAMQAGFVPMLVGGLQVAGLVPVRAEMCWLWYGNGSSFGTRGSAVSG